MGHLLRGDATLRHLQVRSSVETGIYEGTVGQLLTDSGLGKKPVQMLFGFGHSGYKLAVENTRTGPNAEFGPVVELHPCVVIADDSRFYHVSFSIEKGVLRSAKSSRPPVYAGNSSGVIVDANPFETSPDSGHGVIKYSFDLLVAERKERNEARQPQGPSSEEDRRLAPKLLLTHSRQNILDLILDFSATQFLPGLGISFGLWRDGTIRSEFGKEPLYTKLNGEGAVIFRTEVNPMGNMDIHSHAVFLARGHRNILEGGFIGGHAEQVVQNGGNYTLFFPTAP